MFKNLGTLFGPSKIWWLLRQILQFGGLWLVASGYATQEEVNQAAAILPDLFGSISFLVGLAANIYSTFRNSVTVGGEKVPIEKLPTTVKTEVKVEAKKVVKSKNIFEKIFGG